MDLFGRRQEPDTGDREDPFGDRVPRHWPRSPPPATVCRSRKGLHLGDVLGIHGFGAAEPRLVRGSERVRELRVLGRKETLARQRVRCAPTFHHRLRRFFTGIRREQEIGVQHPEQRRADVRFSQVHGVVDDHGRPQVIAEAFPAVADRRLVAPHRSPPSNIRFLQVRGRLHEGVALEHAGVEAAPAVSHVVWRARPVVHPDRVLLLAHRETTVIRHELLGAIFDVGDPSQSRRPGLEGKVERVGAADELGYLEILRYPALGPPASRVAQRQAGVVPVHPAAILIASERPPDARQVNLRKYRRRGQHDQHRTECHSSRRKHKDSVRYSRRQGVPRRSCHMIAQGTRWRQAKRLRFSGRLHDVARGERKGQFEL